MGLEPQEIFEQLESDRESGLLREKVAPNGGYGSSKSYPGHICRFNADGEIIAVGNYLNGEFVVEQHIKKR